MRSNVRKMFDGLYMKTETTYRAVQTRKDAKHIVKNMGRVSDELMETYKKEVLPYWKTYNEKPPVYWFQLFSRDGIHTDAKYIPEDLWYGTILPYYSNMFFRRSYEDKCMHHMLFPNVCRPRTIVKNVAGQFYTDKLELLTPNQALNLSGNEQSFIIKPSVDSGTGRLIKFYDKNKNSKDDIKKMFTELKANYVVQEIVQQHPVLGSLHESSLNTVRILSFFFEGEVYILSAIVRMGAGNARVDNVSSGGMQCGIDVATGQCHTLACTKKRDWVKKSPDGAVFAETQIPAFDKIISIVKEEHSKLPHFRLIGWDFSVTPDEEPVFIEYNVCPGANQMTCGPTFGDLTDRVLDDVLIKKKLAYIQN